MDVMRMSEWVQYRNLLRNISQKAADEFRDAVFNKNGLFGGVGLDKIRRQDLIDYAYGLVTKYSEGAAEAACEFYDALAALSGKTLPAAMPAPTPEYSEVAKAINGVLKISENEELISGSLGRLVKQTGQDTTLLNAKRDGAEVAWIPAGLTCPFCITLASNGWQHVSEKTLKNGHAEHIHANCDCAYGVRFSDDFNVEGYDPERYLNLYKSQSGTPKERINALRREFGEIYTR